MSEDFRSKFRSGAESVQEVLESSNGVGKFTPTHQFKVGEPQYLQFLEPIESLLTMKMHRFIIVSYRENGTKVYAEFISRRDKKLDGYEGYDPIQDRFGEAPKERSILLAARMEPVFGTTTGGKKKLEGFEVGEREFTNRDGEVITVPHIALVNESPYTLFGQVTAQADMGPIEDEVFQVQQLDKRKTFSLSKTGLDAVDLSEELAAFRQEFDFNEYLAELADEDRIHRLIDPLPDDWKITDYPSKDKDKPESSRSRREDTPDEDEPEEETEDRSTRFQDLKDKAKARAEARA